MQELVKLTNIYISGKKEKKESLNHQLLEGIAKYLTHMLKVCNPVNVASVFGIDWFFLSNLIQVIVKKSVLINGAKPFLFRFLEQSMRNKPLVFQSLENLLQLM